MSKKGFTLVEVLIVVVIAVVVTSFAVPSYKKAQNRANYMAAVGVLMDLGNAINMVREDYPDIAIASSPVTTNATSTDEKPSASNLIGWLQTNKYLNKIAFSDGKFRHYSFKISTQGTAACPSCSLGDGNVVACMSHEDRGADYPCAWVDNNGILHNN